MGLGSEDVRGERSTSGGTFEREDSRSTFFITKTRYPSPESQTRRLERWHRPYSFPSQLVILSCHSEISID